MKVFFFKQSVVVSDHASHVQPRSLLVAWWSSRGCFPSGCYFVFPRAVRHLSQRVVLGSLHSSLSLSSSRVIAVRVDHF